MIFNANSEYLDKAHAVLAGRPDLYWIIGGAISGKTTICREISARTGIAIYDMDAYIYDRYMSRYSRERHPANKSWFSAPNPLEWVLSLSWEQFDALNQAANAEYLDLLADDLVGTTGLAPLLFDGGFTHPSILAQAAPVTNIVCLATAGTDLVESWESSEDRLVMKRWIEALPEPDEKWHKFLEFDRLITQTIEAESREYGIESFWRDNDTTVRELAGRITAYFDL
jgi:hypothetical protein